jgi:hypothetical protein
MASLALGLLACFFDHFLVLPYLLASACRADLTCEVAGSEDGYMLKAASMTLTSKHYQRPRQGFLEAVCLSL